MALSPDPPSADGAVVAVELLVRAFPHKR